MRDLKYVAIGKFSMNVETVGFIDSIDHRLVKFPPVSVTCHPSDSLAKRLWRLLHLLPVLCSLEFAFIFLENPRSLINISGAVKATKIA
jgi:hypothetical protein